MQNVEHTETRVKKFPSQNMMTLYNKDANKELPIIRREWVNLINMKSVRDTQNMLK